MGRRKPGGPPNSPSGNFRSLLSLFRVSPQFHYRYLWVAGVVLITGCGPKYPDWFKNPPVDTDRYYYGLGVGEQEEEAVKKGVLEIAGKIETEVTGKVEFSHRYRNGKEQLELLQTSLQKLPLLRLFNLPVVKRGYSRGYYFVVVRLDRLENRRLLCRRGVEGLDWVDKLIYSRVPLSRTQLRQLLEKLDREIIPSLQLAQLLGGECSKELKRGHFYYIKLLQRLQKTPPSLWDRLKELF